MAVNEAPKSSAQSEGTGAKASSPSCLIVYEGKSYKVSRDSSGHISYTCNGEKVSDVPAAVALEAHAQFNNGENQEKPETNNEDGKGKKQYGVSKLGENEGEKDGFWVSISSNGVIKSSIPEKLMTPEQKELYDTCKREVERELARNGSRKFDLNSVGDRIDKALKEKGWQKEDPQHPETREGTEKKGLVGDFVAKAPEGLTQLSEGPVVPAEPSVAERVCKASEVENNDTIRRVDAALARIGAGKDESGATPASSVNSGDTLANTLANLRGTAPRTSPQSRSSGVPAVDRGTSPTPVRR